MKKRERAIIGIVFAFAVFFMMLVASVEKVHGNDFPANTPYEFVDNGEGGEALILYERDSDDATVGACLVLFGKTGTEVSFFLVSFSPFINRYTFMPRVYIEQEGKAILYDTLGIDNSVLHIKTPSWYEFGDAIDRNVNIRFYSFLPSWFDPELETLVVIKDNGMTIIHTYVNPSLQK